MFIGFFYDTIIIGCSLWMLSEERLENKLVIIVNEEDFYINHVLASFVRRIKEFFSSSHISFGPLEFLILFL
jgi:hypothetical protein